MSGAALSHLRAHRQGTLLADEMPTPIRFVLDRDGKLVFPATGATLAADETTLFVPEEAPADGSELQLMLSAQPLDAGDARCDRWRVYHGEPRANVWAIAAIEGAKFDGKVVDEEEMVASNPAAAAEARLCRRLNADRAKLAVVCHVVTGLAPADPVAVGVDPEGIDVRARFGILRLPFRGVTDDPERVIEQLLTGGGGGGS